MEVRWSNCVRGDTGSYVEKVIIVTLLSGRLQGVGEHWCSQRGTKMKTFCWKESGRCKKGSASCLRIKYPSSVWCSVLFFLLAWLFIILCHRTISVLFLELNVSAPEKSCQHIKHAKRDAEFCLRIIWYCSLWSCCVTQQCSDLLSVCISATKQKWNNQQINNQGNAQLQNSVWIRGLSAPRCSKASGSSTWHPHAAAGLLQCSEIVLKGALRKVWVMMSIGMKDYCDLLSCSYKVKGTWIKELNISDLFLCF